MKVAVGISGGIDSAVTVLLLKKQNYDIRAVHLMLYNEQVKHTESIEKLAALLQVKVDFIDLRTNFEKLIIDAYVQERLKGLTPSPCVNCNQLVKWRALINYADKNKIDKVATGHYINIKKHQDTFRVFKAKDPLKDQSYYLWGLPPEVLSRAITPLGEYLKTEIKEIGRQNKLDELVSQKESSGLCFAQNAQSNDFLEKAIQQRNLKILPGEVYDNNNIPIGKHRGLIYYTIGQKKGMHLKTNKKLCVKTMNYKNNSITTDTWQNLYTQCFKATDYYFPYKEELKDTDTISVKVRGFGLNPDPGASVSFLNNQEITIELKHAAWAPAPGQPVVFYKDDLILGGAIIK